jgi:hypothetical protein
MDNATFTVCKICKTWIMYDKDAEKPELCLECVDESKQIHIELDDSAE